MAIKIVLEGFEAAGKSTLGRYLSKVLKLPLYTAGPAPINDEVAIKDCMVQSRSFNCIWDRVTSISRRAYQGDISGVHYEDLEEWHEDLNGGASCSTEKDCKVLHIWCIGVGKHEIKDYDSPEHLDYINTNERSIKTRYEIIMNGINDCLVYDFSIMKMEDVREWINQHAS